VPAAWPDLRTAPLAPIGSNLSGYALRAEESLSVFAPDLGEAAVPIASAAYATTQQAPGAPWPAAVAPLLQLTPNRWLLELFHGPSLSFKDLAMQLIARLYDYALAQSEQRLTVVCATSGDTGGAAAAALKEIRRVDLFVLTPKDRVSEVQRRFMSATGADNVHVVEIESDFDACQAIVKDLFADRDFAGRANLSGVNSINWARIVAQSVYFRIAAEALCAGGLVDFSVPTGNFGDAFSGFVAKATGAPIGRITMATNANDILARALETGRYERAAQSRPTLSPAMDIQVASNFERILYEALGRDGERVRALYGAFAQSGGFDIPADALDFLRAHFSACAISDHATVETMRRLWDGGDRGYLACPHTAVGWAGADARGVSVTLGTAHPAKFPETVREAVGVRPGLPVRCRDLYDRPERIHALPNDSDVVKSFIRERSCAWRA
jgi:threonine synthase